MKSAGLTKARIICSLGIVLCVGGIVGFGVAARQVARQRQTLSWTLAEGRIVDANYQEFASRRSERGAAELRLSYTYNVEGRTYRSDQITRGSKIYRREADRVSSLAKQFQVGDIAMIYYNPNRPNEAVVLPGVNWMAIIGTIGISAAAFFAGYGLARFDNFLNVRKAV
jgi:hypothetical protein